MVMKKIPTATVGLGLMGSSIATCILAAGHPVTSLIRNIEKADEARKRVHGFLQQLKEEKIINEEPSAIMERFVVTDNISLLAPFEVIIESISENVDAKKQLFHQLEKVVSSDAIIGTNTSGIPVSILQNDLKNPERVLGIHWAEPAHITRFMEIVCGDQSDIKYAEKIISLVRGWGKEPSLMRKDIRGFITNRIMYAMLREAFYLVENGYATIEDVDRSLRNDLGYWITFAGPFRFMDLTGMGSYLTVIKGLWPELNNSTKPPEMFEKLVASGAKGTPNAHGFYPYTKESAERWEKLFIDFTYEIRKLAAKYPEDIGDVPGDDNQTDK